MASADVISVQALNEFAHVASRKLGMSWAEVSESIALIRGFCFNVIPIGTDVHEHGLAIADRYQVSFFDALMIAAALSAECDVLWSEDMHHGLLIDGRLRITNPFHA
ncbi:putative nucleic acid-binding protein [Sphingobium boeckii]|uniref:Putative nucleic acid-binding protein n=2 Tax=Sphingobium boeckii TaxID=1082345 RepID=A0A7W9AJD6_9SPHN|nr:putative nucleic acid-binding protein [Sphingobium boeckii]